MHLEMQKTLSPRLSRWLATVVALDFTTIPIRGKSIIVPDAFSRHIHRTDDITFSNTELLMLAIQNTKQLKSLSTKAISFVTNDLENNETVRDRYKKYDEFINSVLKPRHPFSVLNCL